MPAYMFFLELKFGYSQVLFMGSVPRINCHPAIVPPLVVIKYDPHK